MTRFSLLYLTPLFCMLALIAIPEKLKAQTKCEEVFLASSYYRESFLPMWELNHAALGFYEVMKASPDNITVDMLLSKINELENKSEAYFHAAGIPFEKVGTQKSFKKIKDHKTYYLDYSQYFLHGTRTGDEASRLMYGVQANPKFKDIDLTIVYDVLYLFNNEMSHGRFNPEHRMVFIGPHVFGNDAKGVSSILRHELQHYLEQVKVLKGEMTLARLSFTEFQKTTQKEAYAHFLRADELEAHARDLGALLSPTLVEKDKRLFTAMQSEGKMQRVLDIRQKNIEDKVKTLKTLIEKTKAQIQHLEDAIQADKFHIMTGDNVNGISVSFHDLPPPYSLTKIELTGLAPVEAASDRKKIREVLNQVLSWSKQRATQIEN